MTDISQYAHVVLPTTAFGEEEVSFTSTERRIQLAEKVMDPPAGLTPAWQQITQLARLLGADWHYQSAGEVMEEIGEAVSIYGGASYENLARDYGRQWPCTKDRPLGTRFLFGENSNHRPFRFVAVPRPQPTVHTTKDFPFCLVFGSSLYYWNQNVLIRHSETLKREYRSLFLDYPEGFVELNPEDAGQLKVRDGEKVLLRVEGASAVTTARVTPEIMAGTVFVPHFMRDLERRLLGMARNGGQLVPASVAKEAA
jgi:predicted molibdopterin-dependent oxidoreductase YjgC